MDFKKKNPLLHYKDPSLPGSLGGVARFAHSLGVSQRKAQQLLEQDLSYTLHKPRRRRFPTLPVVVHEIDQQWVADLVEVQRLSKNNRGYRYLLTVIDVLSKFARVQALKAKTGIELVKAFEKILKGGRRPVKLQTDQGKEFYDKTFQSLLDKEGIHHFSTHGDAKASIVERFNRTFKERMYRYFTAANTLRYEDVLQLLVRGYNASKHRSIGMAPKDVTLKNEGAVWERLCGQRLRANKPKTKFKVGDRVRLNKKHRLFKKAYLPGWTEEVFLVRRVIRGVVPIYKISAWDETPVEGTFYEQDLQKVHVSSDALFRIENVRKRKKGQLLVKWKGWPDKYNSWILNSEVKKL